MPFVISHISLLLGVALAIVTIYTLYLDHKIVVLTRGENGNSLEAIIKKTFEGVKKNEEENKVIINHASTLTTKLSHAVRNIEIVRYKAFDAGGSNQSFSIALLNERGHGVILTSLHLRDRINTFAKPVQNYTSEHELTEEEESVLTDAKVAHKSIA
jgi:hypothetical protein